MAKVPCSCSSQEATSPPVQRSWELVTHLNQIHMVKEEASQCRSAFGWVVWEGEWGRYFRGFFWVLPLIYTLSDLWQNNLICDKVQTAMGLSVDVIQLETCTMPPNVGQDLWDPWVGSAPPLWTAVVMILVVAWMLANMGARSLSVINQEVWKNVKM